MEETTESLGGEVSGCIHWKDQSHQAFHTYHQEQSSEAVALLSTSYLLGESSTRIATCEQKEC